MEATMEAMWRPHGGHMEATMEAITRFILFILFVLL